MPWLGGAPHPGPRVLFTVLIIPLLIAGTALIINPLPPAPNTIDVRIKQRAPALHARTLWPASHQQGSPAWGQGPHRSPAPATAPRHKDHKVSLTPFPGRHGMRPGWQWGGRRGAALGHHLRSPALGAQFNAASSKKPPSSAGQEEASVTSPSQGCPSILSGDPKRLQEGLASSLRR